MRTLAFAVATLFVVSSAMAQTPRLDAEGYDMDKPARPAPSAKGKSAVIPRRPASRRAGDRTSR
jgi:hypothetical protein